MPATVTRLPVAMKRGRKLTKGPLASLTVLYSLPEVKGSTASVERRLEGIALQVEAAAQQLAKCVLSGRRRAREYQDWIDNSPTVARFPEERRFRSKRDVDRLKSGESEEEDRASDPLSERIAARCKEIVAESDAKGEVRG